MSEINTSHTRQIRRVTPYLRDFDDVDGDELGDDDNNNIDDVDDDGRIDD